MKEKTLKARTVFNGRLLKVDVVDVELESGIKSIREIVRHPGAIVILAQLPDSRFVFVRQFRKPLESETLEAIAGTLSSGENPEHAAIRELAEETGYQSESLKKMGIIFSTPGYTNEKLHIYYAKLIPEQGPIAPDEDEKLDIIYLKSSQIEEMILSNEIKDSKTLAAWLLWKTII